MDLTIDADRTTLLVDHRKHEPVVEGDEFLDFVATLGERGEPFLQEAANCRSAFENVPQRPPGEDRTGSEEAEYRVGVALICSVERLAHQLNQVGSLGLLGHGEQYHASPRARVPLNAPGSWAAACSHNVGMSKRPQVLAVVVVAAVLIVLALLGVATVWLAPAGVYMLLGLGAALIARRLRRNV